jgi:hypothetical protein
MRIALTSLCLATILLTAAGPEPAFAAKKQKTAFKIDLTLEGVCEDVLEWGFLLCPGWDGKFAVSGAMSDRGTAGTTAVFGAYFPVELTGKQGSLSILLLLDETPLERTFEIVGGTGDYANVSGGGTATLDVEYRGYPRGKVDWDNDQYVIAVQKWSLNGTLD